VEKTLTNGPCCRFGGNKTLANWTEFAEKTVALIPACISDLEHPSPK